MKYCWLNDILLAFKELLQNLSNLTNRKQVEIKPSSAAPNLFSNWGTVTHRHTEFPQGQFKGLYFS
jgi:hypothetical protein